jgi:hypothetical protein
MNTNLQQYVKVLPRDLGMLDGGEGGGVSADPADSHTHMGPTYLAHLSDTCINETMNWKTE